LLRTLFGQSSSCCVTIAAMLSFFAVLSVAVAASQHACAPAQDSTADPGYTDAYRGWYDVQGCGECNDYCRWVGDTGSLGDPSVGFGLKQNAEVGNPSWWSCRLAGSDSVYSPRGHFSSFNFQKCAQHQHNTIVPPDDLPSYYLTKDTRTVQMLETRISSTGPTEESLRDVHLCESAHEHQTVLREDQCGVCTWVPNDNGYHVTKQCMNYVRNHGVQCEPGFTVAYCSVDGTKIYRQWYEDSGCTQQRSRVGFDPFDRVIENFTRSEGFLGFGEKDVARRFQCEEPKATHECPSGHTRSGPHHPGHPCHPEWRKKLPYQPYYSLPAAPTALIPEQLESMAQLLLGVRGGDELAIFTPSSHSDVCVEVPHGDKAIGSPLWLQECDGGGAQHWLLTSGAGSTEHYFEIRFGTDKSKCIDAGDMLGPVALRTCNGSPQQAWMWRHGPNGDPFSQTRVWSDTAVFVANQTGAKDHCLKHNLDANASSSQFAGQFLFTGPCVSDPTGRFYEQNLNWAFSHLDAVVAV